MLTDQLVVMIMSFLDTQSLLCFMCSHTQALRCAPHVPCAIDVSTWKVLPCLLDRLRSARELNLSRSFTPMSRLSDLCHNMTMLRRLDLSYCTGLVDAAVEWAGYCCPGLTHLGLAQYMYTSDQWPSDSTLRCIGELYMNIEELDLGGCRGITCAGLEYLSKSTSLASLNLNHCLNISDTGLMYISHCTGLKRLVTKECINITERGMVHVAKACSQLEYLDMSMCPNIGDGVLMYFGTRLTHLNLHQFRHVEKTGLANMSTNITHINLSQPQWLHSGNVSNADLRSCARFLYLQHLDLGMCTYITDEGVAFISSKCKLLQRLSLFRCAGVTDRSLSMLGDECKMLTHVDVGYCWVTDTGVKEMAAGCRMLTNISLQKCIYVTDESIFAIAKYSLMLKYLNVRHCGFVSKYGLRHLCRECRGIMFVDATLCWISDESWAPKTCVTLTDLEWHF